MKRGKLLVFEGVDGSGKTTQIELLKKFLASQGVSWEAVSFPQYGKNEYAEYIYNYLAGKFGDINEVDPYDLARAYANDRKTVRGQILKWLDNGKLVIANRYISSSKAHLGAHLLDDKRGQFIDWVDHLEYEQNGMPKEDLTILLNVDPRIGQKNSQDTDHPDLHEDNLTHLTAANEIFLQLANSEPNWYVVDCMNGTRMKSPTEIQRQVIKVINQKLNE